MIQFVGCFLFCWLLFEILLFIIFWPIFAKSSFARSCSFLDSYLLFLRFLSTAQMLIHINFLDYYFPNSLFNLLCSLFIRTRTWLNVTFFFGIQLSEPNIISLTNLLNIFLQLLELLGILACTVANDVLCEVLGDEKFLLYYFIESCTETIVLSHCSPIILKNTSSNPLYGCFQYLEQPQKQSQHFPIFNIKVLWNGVVIDFLALREGVR